MNNYITLDSMKYLTPWKSFKPRKKKPASVRFTLLGSLDVTYGPGLYKEWVGIIEGPVTSPGIGWGTIADLRTSLETRAGLGFTDHYGTSMTVHAVGEMDEDSISPMWDGASNVIYINVRLVKV